MSLQYIQLVTVVWIVKMPPKTNDLIILKKEIKAGY